MNQSLASKLDAIAADSDTLHQAVRYYIADLTNDMPPGEMVNAMTNSGSRVDVEGALARLTSDSALLDEVCLFVLSAAWEISGDRASVGYSIDEAKQKLPIIEIGILVTAALYGMYLLKTGGIRRSETTLKRKPDGSFEYKQVVEYSDPSKPIGELLNTFKQIGSGGS